MLCTGGVIDVERSTRQSMTTSQGKLQNISSDYCYKIFCLTSTL